jgi:hypothetical protein
MILLSKFLVSCARLWFLCGGLVFLFQQQAHATEAHNVRLVGHCDLQGRETLQVSLKGNYAYVGHHKGDELNPTTNRVEPNGTTIVDVSNPREPKIVTHIPGYKGAQSRAVQIVEKYFDGKDYILRNQESSEFTGFEVWDVTDKANRSASLRSAPCWPPTKAGGMPRPAMPISRGYGLVGVVNI